MSGVEIRVERLNKSFGRHVVWRDVTLTLPAGEISVMLGPSGTGKSVLLKSLVGLIRPDAGSILIEGRDLVRLRERELYEVRKLFGVMFQDGALFSSMTVFENVAFPLRQHTDLKDRAVRELVVRQLQAVGLERAGDQFPASLSGGMRKRAGLARALVLEPRILLCDEPDSGLDPVRTALLGELLVERHLDLGGTIVTVTHNIELAKIVGEHVSVLYEGQVRQAGPGEELWESDDEFVRQFLAGATEGPLDMGVA